MTTPDDEALSATQCAARTGLTVRALRAYEREGLLCPARSAKGWRLYGPAELVRLNTIVILKALGLTLAQIGAVLTGHPLSLLRILEVQSQSWKVKLAETQRAVNLVEVARRRLQSQQELSVNELCDLIRSLETARSSTLSAQTATMKDLIPEVITPDEQREWTHPEQAGDLAVVRRAYAKQILAVAGVTDIRIETAFAAVPREKFLGPGPWFLSKVFMGRGVATPDADPVYLYTDDPVMIVPGINNGQPSFHANLLAQALPGAGEHLVHIGAGVGYYTAMAAELVGPCGRVTAVEFNPELADRARRNLADRENVQLVEGDGTRVQFNSADIIYVSAGATRFIDGWLDRLAEGGRLILPLTPDKGVGAVFRIERRGEEFLANWISGVVIYPCEAARDESSERALAAALGNGRVRSVTRLYRHDRVPAEDCWLRGAGWCLAYR